MMKKKILAAAALATSGALLAGCSSSGSASSIAPDSTLAVIELVTMDMSMETSENTQEVGANSETYKLLVVSKDGSTRVVEAEDKGPFFINWTPNYFFIADSKSATWKQSGKDDVKVDNSLDLDSIFASTKLGDKGTFLFSSYDSDKDKVSYVTFSQKGIEKTLSDTFIYNIGTCGQTTYGVSVEEPAMSEMDEADVESMSDEEFENYAPTLESRAEVSLFKVAEGEKVEISPIGKHSAVMDSVNLLSSSLACSGDEIVFLAMQNELEGGLYKRTQELGEPINFNLNDYRIGSEEEGGYSVLTLERWNVKTGEHTIVPVASADGQPFMKLPHLVTASSIGGTSLQGDTFYWVDGLGRLVAIDVKTGKSNVLTKSLQTTSDMDKLAAIFVTFHEDNVTILVHSDAEPEKDRIVSLEIPSGKEIVSVDVPKLGGLVEPIDWNDPEAWDSMSSMTSVITFHANPNPKG